MKIRALVFLVFSAAACMPVPDLSDGQILQAAVSANRGEVDVAQSVLLRLDSASAREIAQTMIIESSAMALRLGAVGRTEEITPAPSEITTQLEAETSAAIESLREPSGCDLDVAYLKSQIAMHSSLEETLRFKLLPASINKALWSALAAMHKQVVEHLEMAEDTLDALEGACLATPEMRPAV